MKRTLLVQKSVYGFVEVDVPDDWIKGQKVQRAKISNLAKKVVMQEPDKVAWDSKSEIEVCSV